MEKYFSTKLTQQKYKGFLSLNFEIRLDPSWTEKIGKLRINRLQTLEVLSGETSQKIKRKYGYLKNSLGKKFFKERKFFDQQN